MESKERFESYYSVLGISSNCSVNEIRRAYRNLAMQWHPDRCARKNPSMLAEAKRKFQKIQEAYSVLSDPNKREMYDAGLYDPNDEEDEGFYDFMHEMFDLMAQVSKEEKPCSMEDLQNSFSELLESFQTPQWIPSPLNQMTNSHGLQQSTSGSSLSPEMSASDLNVFGVNSFCRLKF